MTDENITLDPHTLRGLAHPLRVRLLNLLREKGPSTASKLAELTGESSGATSYHLRQLATYGFIEEAVGHGVGRERWWRSVHRGTTLEMPASREISADAEGYLLAVANADFQRLSQFLGRLRSVPPVWHEAWTISNQALRLTPEEADRLHGELMGVIARYPRADPDAVPPAGTERVAVQLQLFPQV